MERSQRTDRMEFWSTIDLKESHERLKEQLAQWMQFYNQHRTHSGIHCKTPLARLRELLDTIPTRQAVLEAYIPPTRKYVTNSNWVWVYTGDA